MAVAIVGNLPLLIVYADDRVGSAIIAATTISGTMVMGLAPVSCCLGFRLQDPRAFVLRFGPVSSSPY
ncbi:hypothetical protein ASG57_27240 [Bradyrhizobium sp. Leaf396]|jgi:solute:Na+ symporter, SSS family|nr:hypothetical protein ASG57_27240 [Bradyrhizobium sp. Leaf396]